MEARDGNPAATAAWGSLAVSNGISPNTVSRSGAPARVLLGEHVEGSASAISGGEADLFNAYRHTDDENIERAWDGLCRVFRRSWAWPPSQ